jgi:conjugative transfer region protein (TIGR03748 family)
MKRVLFAMILLSMSASEICLANENDTQVGRYVTVSNKPKSYQVDLLTQTIQVRSTSNIQTVGDEINYLLKLSGYSLVPEIQRNVALKIILRKPLPVVDRELGPVSLKDGLMVLVGPAFELERDPINRTIDFKLKPEYQKFLKNQN